MTRDSGDRRAQRAHPSPSLVIADWRRVQRHHPRSSQIGVDFSEKSSFGVDFVGFWFQIAHLPNYPIYPILPLARDSRFQLQIFVFSRSCDNNTPLGADRL